LDWFTGAPYRSHTATRQSGLKHSGSVSIVAETIVRLCALIRELTSILEQQAELMAMCGVYTDNGELELWAERAIKKAHEEVDDHA